MKEKLEQRNQIAPFINKSITKRRQCSKQKIHQHLAAFFTTGFHTVRCLVPLVIKYFYRPETQQLTAQNASTNVQFRRNDVCRNVGDQNVCVTKCFQKCKQLLGSTQVRLIYSQCYKTTFGGAENPQCLDISLKLRHTAI